jgi:xylan 1,4-beta-xylosidase
MTDIGAIAARNAHKATAMIWNYHDDDTTGNAATVVLQCTGIPARQVTVKQYRIDAAHSNSYEVWKKMGSPQQPTAEQITQLEKAGKLEQTETSKVTTVKGAFQMNMQVPRQGVAFVNIEY